MNPSDHPVDVDQLLRCMDDLVAMLQDGNPALQARLQNVDSK
jgi:hypothetical protein